MKKVLNYINSLSKKSILTNLFLILFTIFFIFIFLLLDVETKLSFRVIVISEVIFVLIASVKLFYFNFEEKLPNIKESKHVSIFIIFFTLISLISIEAILSKHMIYPMVESMPSESKMLIGPLSTIFNGTLFFTITYLILKINEGFKLNELDVNGTKFFNGYKWTFSIWLTVIFFKIVIIAPEHYNITFTLDKTFIMATIDFITYVFFVGISEEVVFRSFIFNQLRLKFQKKLMNKKIGLVLALIITNILFSLIHLPLWIAKGVPILMMLFSLLFTFTTGILFSVFYLVTGNIFLVSGIHGLIDFDNSNSILYIFIMFIMFIIILFKRQQQQSSFIDETSMSVRNTSAN